MKKPWLFYCGTLMAGRQTTLRALGQALSSTPPTWRSGSDRWNAAIRGREIVISAEPQTSRAYVSVADVIDDPTFVGLVESLRLADGIIFIADSQASRATANKWFVERLRSDLRLVHRDIDSIPIVFQLNKRDLPEIMSFEQMSEELSSTRCAYVTTIANSSVNNNVISALEVLLKLIGDTR